MSSGETARSAAVIQRAPTGDQGLDRVLSGGFPRGSLILVSGNPGTGKTTLTAGFLWQGAKAGENGIYVSFSESKRSFYDNMASFGLDFEQLEKDGHFRFLETFSATREGMSEIAKYILEETKRFGAKRLVIDSYTVMAQALGNQYEGRQVLHTFFSRVMRNMDCTTLVIGEQPTGEFRIGDTSEEFVADGVLNLKLTVPRQLEIRKMRGTRLKSRDLLYTLEGGFSVVTTRLRTPEMPKPWVPIPDSGNLLSSGSRDLDEILGGGFPRGTYAVVEVATNVMVAEVDMLVRGIALNFVSQGRGVAMIPIPGVDSRNVKRSFGPYVSDETFDRYMKISEQVEVRPSRQGETPAYLVPITYGEGGKTENTLIENSDAFGAAEKKLMASGEGAPIARIISYDNLETSYSRYQDRLLNEVGLAMVRTRASGNLTVAVARSSVPFLPKVLGMVDWHIKLTKDSDVLLVQGEKPHTAVYAADCDVTRGFPVMTLKMLT